jgi:hypothetical protein
MDKPRPKKFNTAGVCSPTEHYMLPVLPRVPGVGDLIEGNFYFVLHAPRQSGKTTFLKTITDKINLDGCYYALCCSLEASDGVDDVDSAMSMVVAQINKALKKSNLKVFTDLALKGDPLADLSASEKVSEMLNYLSVNLDKDLVVFFDESDCLSGKPLILFLRQIRMGYNDRFDSPASKFPRSLALAGMRDIRDYVTQVRPGEMSRGLAGPFNVKKESLTLANFTRDEIRTLYSQHTAATGQKFTDEAIDRAWYWTEGQPWLVNALANEEIVGQLKNDYSKVIDGSNFDQAAETLIQRRDTHIDSLLVRLQEPRVIMVMDAVFSGSKGTVPINSDDRQYCIDLGLVVKKEDGSLRPANAIYKEVISRVITDQLQYVIGDFIKIKKWTDGKVLFLSDILKDFQRFFRHDSDSFPSKFKKFAAYKYDEATYAFILQSFLQKIVNGGGNVYSEFSEGSGRVDLVVIYKGREYMIEVKLEYADLEESLAQLAGYLDKNAEKEGWLIIFDRTVGKTWEEKIYWDTRRIGIRTIHVIGC